MLLLLGLPGFRSPPMLSSAICPGAEHDVLKRQPQAQLLVVGHRGHGGFAGLLLSSLARGVLHHAPCPVAVVRRSSTDARGTNVAGCVVITEHSHGTDGVRTLANLAILRGAAGTPGCCGILPLRGQNNVQGASDMGALPDNQPISDRAVRDRFSEAWGVPIPDWPGLRIPQMFDAAVSGQLRALYVIGEDIAQSDPRTSHVLAALDACEFVVCHDLFLPRTAGRADVVLPAVSFLEKDGTFVNFDRRFQRVRPAVSAPGSAMSDFDILQRLDTDGPLHWPCRDPELPGEAVALPRHVRHL